MALRLYRLVWLRRLQVQSRHSPGHLPFRRTPRPVWRLQHHQRPRSPMAIASSLPIRKPSSLLLPLSDQRFESLLVTHQPFICNFICRYAPVKPIPPEDMEDLLSAANAAAWRRRANYNPNKGVFGTWLGRVVSSTTINHYRRSLNKPRTIPSSPSSQVLIDQQPQYHPQEASDLLITISSLHFSPAQHRVLTKILSQQLTFKEGEALLGVPRSVIRDLAEEVRALLPTYT